MSTRTLENLATSPEASQFGAVVHPYDFAAVNPSNLLMWAIISILLFVLSVLFREFVRTHLYPVIEFWIRKALMKMTKANRDIHGQLLEAYRERDAWRAHAQELEKAREDHYRQAH